jgi:antitoxin (DNA-binding transcriptional repressor) of toxin-antitoxin stability system
MQTITLKDAQSHLAAILDGLAPGEEVILTRDDKAVARLIAGATEQPRPLPGRGKGMLTILSDDEDHLKDFAEYMP